MFITEMCKQKSQPLFSPSWTWSLIWINFLLSKNWKSSCLEKPGSQIRGLTQKSSSNSLYLMSFYHWWVFFFCLAQSSLLDPFALGKRCLSSALVWGAGDAACAAQLDLLTGFQLCATSLFSNPVQQLFTFQAINIITIMLRSNFGKFCSEPLRLRRDSFSWDLSFWWKPNCSFGFV